MVSLTSGTMANYRSFKVAYGKPRNLAKMEGFNLLWKLARINWIPLVAGELVSRAPTDV